MALRNQYGNFPQLLNYVDGSGLDFGSITGPFNYGDYIYYDGNNDKWTVGDSSISLGYQSGQSNQSLYSVAMGYQAGQHHGWRVRGSPRYGLGPCKAHSSDTRRFEPRIHAGARTRNRLLY